MPEQEKRCKYLSQRVFKSLKWILDNYSKIYVDHSFQRRGGLMMGSGWTLHDSEIYACEILTCGADNRVKVADVETNLVYAKKAVAGDLPDFAKNYTEKQLQRNLEYWQDLWDKGYLYLSVDGNNSTSAAYYFAKGEIRSYNEKTSEYEHISERPAEDLYSCGLEFLVYQCIHIAEVKRKFVGMNKAEKLKPAQLRNAVDTELAYSIRDMAVKWAPVFKYFIFPDPIIKRPKNKKKPKKQPVKADKRRSLNAKTNRFFDDLEPDTMLTKIYVALSGDEKFTKNMSDVNCNKLYNNTEVLDEKITKDLDKVLQQMRKMCKDKAFRGGVFKKGQFYALVFLTHSLLETRYKIKSPALFLEWFLGGHEELKSKAKELDPPLQDQKDRQARDYGEWIKNSDKLYAKFVYLWKDRLLHSLSKLQEKGVISRNRDSADSFSREYAPALVFAQECKDRFGKGLSYIGAYQGDVVIDHINSVADGGLTEFANAEAMSREDNLKKGAASYEPVFDHSQRTAQQRLCE
jgi:hypothetical protein